MRLVSFSFPAAAASSAVFDYNMFEQEKKAQSKNQSRRLQHGKH
jgi:hypothetical protein